MQSTALSRLPNDYQLPKNQNRNQIDSLLNQLDQITKATNIIDVLNEIAWYQAKTDIDSAKYYVDKAIQKNTNNTYLKGQLKSTNILGIIAYHNSDFELSITFFKKALEISNKINDTIYIAKISNNIGTIYQMLGKYTNSLHFNMKSLVIKEKLCDTSGIINSLINISNLYYQLNKFKEGIEFSTRALDLINHSNSSKLSTVMNTLGALYKEIGEYQTSIHYLNEALIINIINNDRKKEAMNYQNIAATYVELKDINIAMEYYNKSIVIKKELGDIKGLSKTKMSIGILKYQQKEYLSAIDDLSEAKIYYEYTNQLFELKSIYSYLAKCYAAMRIYEEAYNHLSLCYDVNDSLYSMECKIIIEEMEMKYEANQKQLQIEKQAILIKKKNASIQLYMILAICIFIGGFIVFWLLLTKQKTYKKLVEKNYLIATKNEKEKTNHKNALQQHKDIYSRLINSIETELIYTDIDLTIDKLAKTIKTNRTDLSEVIHLYTEKTYPDFINEYRINHAVKLLSGNGQKFSIDAIAMESGFRSVSNFYKLFKKYTGLTPSAFQKKRKI